MSKRLAIKKDYSPPLLVAVLCIGADLGLRGALLRRCEAQARPHSISSLEEISRGRLGGSTHNF